MLQSSRCHSLSSVILAAGAIPSSCRFFVWFLFSTGRSAALFRELTLYHTHTTQALRLLIHSWQRCSIGRLLPRQWWCAAARILMCTRVRLEHARPRCFFHLLHGTFRHRDNHPKIKGKGWGRHGGLGVRCVWGGYLPTPNLHQQPFNPNQVSLSATPPPQMTKTIKPPPPTPHPTNTAPKKRLKESHGMVSQMTSVLFTS